MKVPFLDLKAQYNSIKDEVNPAIQEILDNTAYILGKSVSPSAKATLRKRSANMRILPRS